MNRLTLYERLKPEYKITLSISEEQYDQSVKTIIKKLDSTYFWSELTIGEIEALDIFEKRIKSVAIYC
jgi:uncharacterized protein YgiM (DUF1202 family)